MGRVITYRLATALPLLLATSLFSFLLLYAAPGSFVDLLRFHPGIPDSAVESLVRRYGLDQPWYVQYVSWLAGVLRADLGMSLAFERPVADLLAAAVPRTLVLAATGHLAAIVVGVGLGLAAVRNAGGALDRAVHRAAVLLASIHPVVLATLGLLAAVVTGIVPPGGGSSPGAYSFGPVDRVRDYLAHLVLPGAILALVMLPGFVLQARGALAEALQAPFVRAARARGLPEATLLRRHVLPAARVPLLSYAGASLGWLLNGAFLVEIVTAWPGMGRLALRALYSRDPFLLLGTLVVAAGVLTLGNLAVDVALAEADPRVRLEERMS